MIRTQEQLLAIQCVEQGLELSSVLEYLHQQRLIHRDIKPPNILFVHGKAKFADVGLVTQIEISRDTATNVAFRVVLHLGQIFTGGAASLGEESLQGKEVHFILRMEKPAGAIGERWLLNRTAKEPLQARFQFTEIGSHRRSGFDGVHPFHALSR